MEWLLDRGRGRGVSGVVVSRFVKRGVEVERVVVDC